MKIVKKLRKDENTKIAGHLLAVRNIIRMFIKESIDVLMITKLKKITAEIKNADFYLLDYVTLKLAESIPDNVELLEETYKIIYTEGVGKGINLNEEAYTKFLALLNDYITIERIKEIAGTFDKKQEDLNTLLESARILNSLEHGEEFVVE